MDMLQQQLDEVRALLQRARALFGENPVAPADLERPAGPVADPQTR